MTSVLEVWSVVQTIVDLNFRQVMIVARKVIDADVFSYNTYKYNTKDIIYVLYSILHFWLITLPGGCPNGYVERQGDLPGWGTDIGSALDLSRQECAEKCDGASSCMSFEHSDTEMKCNLNKIAEPSQGPFRDYVFCTKMGKTINLVNVSMYLLY